MIYPPVRVRQQGFTLVELSIVLVIIGLIIGGVLTGQQIIQNARITNAINAVQAYQAQLQTYAQNYGVLPGDDPSATTRFPSVSSIVNGNGDGAIGTTGKTIGFEADTSSGESHLLWAHLRAAGLIKNQTNGTNTAVYPPNPFGGVFAFQNGAFGSVFSTTVLCLNSVPSMAAQAIDARLDDGVSNSGAIQASTGVSTGTVATSYDGSSAYTVCIRM